MPNSVQCGSSLYHTAQGSLTWIIMPQNIYSTHQMCHVQDESHQETGQENEEHTNTLIGVPDTYQDGEFYQALLSEFLEGSTNLLTKNLHKVCDDRIMCTRLT